MNRLATHPLTALLALALSAVDSAGAILDRVAPLPDSVALLLTVLLVAGVVGWIKVEPFKSDANLNPRDLQTLLALHRLPQSLGGGDGVIIKELAEVSGIPRWSVADSLSVLRAAGWVRRTGREGGEPVRWALSEEALELVAEGRVRGAKG